MRVKENFPLQLKTENFTRTQIYFSNGIYKLDQSLETRATSHNTVSLDS